MSAQQDLQLSIHVSTTAASAYNAISKVTEWWGQDLEGNSTHAGDKFTIHFGDTFVDFKVTEAEPGLRYVWAVENCFLPWLEDKTEWNGTRACWDLAEANGTTTITLTHEGLTPQIECFENCKTGWEYYATQSLYNLIVDGKGMPDSRKRCMSQFAFVYRQVRPDMSPEQMQRHIDDCQNWFDDLIAKGFIKDVGVPLGTERSAVITQRGVIHDGPFAEAKDVIGGFTLVEAKDLAHAVELAQTCPIIAVGGAVEVRPVQRCQA